MSLSVSPPLPPSTSSLQPTAPATSTSKRPSPPRTPVDQASRPRSSSSTPSDDSSIIDDLSFDYVFDDEGNYVRLSKGSSSKSNNSTPPTPAERLLRESDPPLNDPNLLQPKPPSPISLNSPVRRASLSRSESAYPVLNGPSTTTSERTSSTAAARSFQRVASGPALITTSSLAPQSHLKPRMVPRRITTEDYESRSRKQTEDLIPHTDDESRLKQEEKENHLNPSEDPYVLAVASTRRNSPPLTTRSASLSGMPSSRLPSQSRLNSATRPLVDVPVPQRSTDFQILPGPNRPGRVLKGASAIAAKYSVTNGFERISEVNGMENEVESHERDSAPYTDGDTDIVSEDNRNRGLAPPPASAPPGPTSNPLTYRQRSHGAITGSSAPSLEKSSNNRPRRSASLSEASVHDDNQYNYQAHSAYPHQDQQPYVRPGTSLGLNHQSSTSKPHGIERRVAIEELQEMTEQQKYLREEKLGRRTPETLYEYEEHQYPSQLDGVPHPHRPTNTHRRRDSDTLRSTAYTNCGSPTAVEMSRPSPIDIPPKRLSPVSRSSSAMHRRSPTAPEPPTTSGTLAPTGGVMVNGKTWAAGDEGGMERGREQVAGAKAVSSKHQPLPTQQHVRPPPAVPASQSQPVGAQSSRQIVVNKKVYARLDMIGKGGTSRVYRVMNSANELYAIKRVSLDRTDAEALHGYMNEIALLKRLDGNSRIIRLIDSELKAGPGGTKGVLLMVMECGEIDLARLLHEQQKEPMNMVWIAYYWQQMLQAVHVIHEEKIVHSDLKPANFVLVKGQLKLIDFGIANAIANDTTNIQRDVQVGTVNYMSPEAIELPDGMRRLKVGRPSDIWSLGCILYQMVYGRPPFHNLNMYQKMKAIPDLTHTIDFPEHSTPSIPTSRSPGSSTPPKPLEHLKRKVRKDVIDCMKSCLCRNPKERATIPQLLAQEWLAIGEQQEQTSESKTPQLAPDETVINPHYMRQLLQYGIQLGQSGGADMDPESLMRVAERLIAELQAIQRAS